MPVHRAQFSPCGDLVASAGDDDAARLWDAITGLPHGQVLRHDGPVVDVVFSADGRLVATASNDHTARTWDSATGIVLSPALRHGHTVQCVEFSPDGGRVATGSDDRTARIWNATTGNPISPSLAHDDVVNRVTFSADGLKLAPASGGPRRSTFGDARVWDAHTGEPLTAWFRHPNDVYDAVFDTAGEHVYTSCWDGFVRKYRLARDERPVAELVLLCKILAGSTIDATGASTALDGTAFREAWESLANAGTYAPRRSATGLTAWHQRCLEASRRANDFGRTLYHLSKLIELCPGDVALYAQRGRAHGDLADWSHAEADLLAAHERGVDDPAVLAMLAGAQLRQGRDQGYRRSIAILRERLVKNRALEIAQALAAAALLAPQPNGSVSDCLAVVAAAARESADRCTFWHLLGALQYRSGDWAEAVESLRRAISLHGGDGTIQDGLLLAMAQARLGQNTEARTIFDRCQAAMATGRGSRGSAWQPTGDEILLREAHTVLQP